MRKLATLHSSSAGRQHPTSVCCPGTSAACHQASAHTHKPKQILWNSSPASRPLHHAKLRHKKIFVVILGHLLSNRRWTLRLLRCLLQMLRQAVLCMPWTGRATTSPPPSSTAAATLAARQAVLGAWPAPCVLCPTCSRACASLAGQPHLSLPQLPIH